MNRELRLYLFAIALPALLLAAGGVRLLRVERERARAAGIETLRLRTVGFAAAFERALAEKSRDLLAPLAAETNAVARRAAARRIAEADPDVIDVRLPPPRGGEPSPRDAGFARGGRGVRGGRRGAGPPERGFPAEPDGDAPGRGGPRRNGAGARDRWSADDSLVFSTKLPGGEPVRVSFRPSWTQAALADVLSSAAAGVAPPSGFSCLAENGRRIAFAGTVPAEAWLSAVRTSPVAGIPFPEVPKVAPDGVSIPVSDAHGEPDVPVPDNLERFSTDVPVLETNVRLCAFWTPDALPAPRGFFLLGGCLLALLFCSLVAGGWLLVRTARRERLDALRKTGFVDNVSHELKTPLAGIRLSAELLSEGRLPEGPRRDKAVRSILSESDRLERLVSNLLDFGRLERGRRDFNVRVVDVGELLRELPGASVEPEASGEPLRALADPDAVRQIVLNLLDNAAKYAADGGPPEVSARRRGDGMSAIRVADRGPGVPSGLEEKVFERFFRADNALNRASNGSGLGLSIARGLARGMGGDLVCRPRDGGGALFELTLPSAPA